MKKNLFLFSPIIRKESIMSDRKPMSLNDFKDWLENQQDLGGIFNLNRNKIVEDENDKFIGKHCKSKVSERKLLEKMETDDVVEELVEEFLTNGGTILATDGKQLHIEVDSGEFYLPRFCVKIKKK